MSENKIGDVVVVKTETRQEAFYQLADGTSTFLCAVAANDCEDAVLRQRVFRFRNRNRARAPPAGRQQRNTCPARHRIVA